MLLASIQRHGKFGWLVAVLAWPGGAIAQVQPAPVSVQQYLEFIDLEQDNNGLTSPALIEPLTALGQQYYAQQEYDLAVDAFMKARQVTRVNDGFDTLQEMPLIAHLVRAEEARGNFAEAWELEQALLTLAEQNVGKLETLPVLRELAQKRLDIWERYRTGEIPPQIVLGCYYNKGSYIASAGTSSWLNNASPDVNANCSAGSWRTVRLALLLEARSYMMLALEALLQNDGYASDELQQLLLEMLRVNYALQARGLGSGDPLLARMMERLLSWEMKDSAHRVRRAQILLLLADMNVVRADEYRRYNGFDAVREQYQQAYKMLQDENVGQEQLDEIFAPSLPVVLPAFAPNPLAKVAEADATGYIDIAFEITNKGQSRRIKIVGTGGAVMRADQRELQRMISLGIFRPRMGEGQVADSAPVVLRYYLRASQ